MKLSSRQNGETIIFTCYEFDVSNKSASACSSCDGVQSIAISVSVCLSVSPFAHLKNTHPSIRIRCRPLTTMQNVITSGSVDDVIKCGLLQPMLAAHVPAEL